MSTQAGSLRSPACRALSTWTALMQRTVLVPGRRHLAPSPAGRAPCPVGACQGRPPLQVRSLSHGAVARQTDSRPGHKNIAHQPCFWPPELPVFLQQPVQDSSLCQVRGAWACSQQTDRLVAHAKKHWSIGVNQQLPESLFVLRSATSLPGESGVAQCLVPALQRPSKGTCTACSACPQQGCTPQLHA